MEAFFTAVTVRVGVDPVLPAASGSAWVDALAAVAAAAATIAARFAAPVAPPALAVRPVAVGSVGWVWVWATAVALTGGALLSPAWPPPRPPR